MLLVSALSRPTSSNAQVFWPQGTRLIPPVHTQTRFESKTHVRRDEQLVRRKSMENGNFRLSGSISSTYWSSGKVRLSIFYLRATIQSVPSRLPPVRPRESSHVVPPIRVAAAPINPNESPLTDVVLQSQYRGRFKKKKTKAIKGVVVVVLKTKN
ncbi:uncharacterized protein BKA78DRAFT_94253 [Phyllosticta capitalensis]|uniref:uncharacterized protein n=1 Tax=Phyllosticta capitalensis TaxID=121624 RepID=UPI00312F5B59